MTDIFNGHGERVRKNGANRLCVKCGGDIVIGCDCCFCGSASNSGDRAMREWNVVD